MVSDVTAATLVPVELTNYFIISNIYKVKFKFKDVYLMRTVYVAEMRKVGPTEKMVKWPNALDDALLTNYLLYSQI